MLPAQRDALVGALLLSPRMQRLWDVGDRGMPVFVHSLDVVLLCLEQIGRRTDLDVTAIVLGALIHDASKLPSFDEQRSHSLLMRQDPWPAADVSMELLVQAEQSCGVQLDDARREHVRHIVLAHHGPHGRIHPQTEEARLVAACDALSGTQHRLAPIDANDMLPLLAEGFRWPRAAARLGVSRELVKTRLREACLAEGVRDWVDLLPIWHRNGTVRAGTPERQRQVGRARYLFQLAGQVPDCLLVRLAAVSSESTTSLLLPLGEGEGCPSADTGTVVASPLA